MPTTADDLPDGVLHHVFSLVLKTDSFSLSKASLVCRRWRLPAQRALAMNVSLLCDINSRRADEWIKSLLGSQYQIQSLDVEHHVPATVVRVLECCRGLRRLRLWSANGSPLAWIVLVELKLADVQILELASADSLALCDNLVSSLPIPFAFKLHTLALSFNDQLPCSELLDRLFDAGHSSLKSLIVECAAADAALYPLLEPKFNLIAPTLTHIPFHLLHFPLSLCPLLSLCTALLSLTFTSLP